MKRPDIIQGGRAELERELLEAVFAPGGEPLAEELKARLAPRGRRNAWNNIQHKIQPLNIVT